MTSQFLQEYLGHWTEEDNSFFKIQHRLAAIDYILETEAFDEAVGNYNRSASIQNAIRVRNRIKETHNWKTVWEFVEKYRDWSLGALREERERLSK